MSNQIIFENGGAEAIKGFNFQKANLILIAINNYLKENFQIYIEAEDDIVVSYTGYKAYIQVKKQKHSISTLTKKKTKKIKNSEGEEITIYEDSIFEKNLMNGSDADTFKIIVKEIATTDLKKFQEVKSGNIFNSNFSPNQNTNTILKSKIPNCNRNKIDRLFINISPISDELAEAIKYLIGCLSEKNISVDNRQGRAIIAELSLTIDEKADVIVQSPNHYELKALDSQYLSTILITSQKLKYFDEILSILGYTHLKNKSIKKARLNIELSYTALKDRVREFIKNMPNIEDIPETNIIESVLQEFNTLDITSSTLIAVAIESICEIGEE